MIPYSFFSNPFEFTPDAVTEGYGKLYNCYATEQPYFAPIGWRVPLLADFATLSTHFGGDTVSGGYLKQTGLTHWDTPNTDATDISGFTALPGGYRYGGGTFESINEKGIFHINQWYTGGEGERHLLYNTDNLDINFSTKYKGKSVRLIKTDSTDPGTVTDFDGNVYNTVKIGDQVWTSENYRCVHYQSGTLIPEITGSTEWVDATTPGWCYYDNDSGNN